MEFVNPDLFYPLRSSGPEFDGDDTYALTVYDLGDIHLPSGQVEVCDPFTAIGQSLVFSCPKGSFPVKVTVADVSLAQDGSELRHAYASIIFSPGEPGKFAAVYPESFTKKQCAQIPYLSVAVKGEAVAFVDATAAKMLGAESDLQHDKPQLSAAVAGWRQLIDDPQHYHQGLVNTQLPGVQQQENICIGFSGWGNGSYPIIGGYDADGQLISLHVDLLVVGDYRYETDDDG